METQTPSLKHKVKAELSEYFLNVAFLALFFSTYAITRRLTLAQYGIYLDDYFVGIIKALVIGKVIMMASFLRISKLFEDKPLIVPIFYKVLIFAFCAVLFDVLEGLIKGMITTSSFSGGFGHVIDHHFSKMWLGGVVFVTVSFIPFFALKELSRLVGHEKFRDFLLKGPAQL